MQKLQLYIALLVFTLVARTSQGQDSASVWTKYLQVKEVQKPLDAIDQLQSILLDAKALQLDVLSVTIKKDLAELYLDIEQDDKGLRMYFQLSNEFLKAHDYEQLYDIYMSLSDYYEQREFPNNSAEYDLLALDLADSSGLEIDEPQLTYDIGRLKLSAFEFDESLTFLDRADSLSVDENRDDLLLQVLRLKAKAYEKTGQLDKAVITNERILSLLDEEKQKADYTKQLNNLGFIEQKRGETEEALKYFLRTLKEREASGFKDDSHIPLLINIGVSYQRFGKPVDAKKYFDRALNVVDAKAQPGLKAEIYDLISMNYFEDRDLYNAKIYNDMGMDLMTGDQPEVEMELNLTASMIYEMLIEYEDALVHYKSYLEIKDSIDLANRLSKDELIQQQLYVQQTEKEIQSLVDKNEIRANELEQLELASENKDIQLKNQELDAKQKLQTARFREQELEAEGREQEFKVIKAREENQRLKLNQQKLEEDKNKQDILLKDLEIEKSNIEIQKTRSIARNLVIIVLLAVVVMFLALFAVTKIRKSNKIIQVEKSKSDKLLLNILPESTAEELKTLGASLPRRYEKVAVLFTDFKGFTQITETMSAEQLVDSLSLFFAGFDDIMKKYGLEKIKTIGDAYMCAGGIPDALENPSERLIYAANEMLDFTEKINTGKREQGQATWGIRIGIHTGPVVAGVIGNYKFQYDIWGDTVNLAARMESSGEPGRINISESTFNDVHEKIKCTYRGEIAAKNKGNVKMYFVNS
jgi:adenylate cyclase